ncbi:IS3 family transposase [Fluviispira multicolorata]|uniref:IS3 family transposase n=1 Tax=Fluviispira multicolorata TaxID=2654512 RepID=A0A833JBW8_9BACT|nr:IS3 family transposase [Fluviispira multicolorata]KAB8029203.1 IS3 family transposase [Fluviispira multicolorata]
MLENENYPVFLLCKVMCISKSGFYKWFECKDKNYHLNYSLEEEIKKIHTSSRGTYGRSLILSTLKKSFIKVGKKRVSKIMKNLNINGVGKPKFRTTTKIDRQAIHFPNLISGDFTSYKPNQLWTRYYLYFNERGLGLFVHNIGCLSKSNNWLEHAR